MPCIGNCFAICIGTAQPDLPTGIVRMSPVYHVRYLGVKIPKNPQRNTINTMGILVGVHPICPLNLGMKRMKLATSMVQQHIL